jgi:hypothetical protein
VPARPPGRLPGAQGQARPSQGAAQRSRPARAAPAGWCSSPAAASSAARQRAPGRCWPTWRTSPPSWPRCAGGGEDGRSGRGTGANGGGAAAGGGRGMRGAHGAADPAPLAPPPYPPAVPPQIDISSASSRTRHRFNIQAPAAILFRDRKVRCAEQALAGRAGRAFGRAAVCLLLWAAAALRPNPPPPSGRSLAALGLLGAPVPGGPGCGGSWPAVACGESVAAHRLPPAPPAAPRRRRCTGSGATGPTPSPWWRTRRSSWPRGT